MKKQPKTSHLPLLIEAPAAFRAALAAKRVKAAKEAEPEKRLEALQRVLNEAELDRQNMTMHLERTLRLPSITKKEAVAAIAGGVAGGAALLLAGPLLLFVPLFGGLAGGGIARGFQSRGQKKLLAELETQISDIAAQHVETLQQDMEGIVKNHFPDIARSLCFSVKNNPRLGAAFREAARKDPMAISHSFYRSYYEDVLNPIPAPPEPPPMRHSKG